MLTQLIKLPFQITRDVFTLAEDVVVATVETVQEIPAAIQEGLNEGLVLEPNHGNPFEEVDKPKAIEAQIVTPEAQYEATKAARIAEIKAELAELEAMECKPTAFKSAKA